MLVPSPGNVMPISSYSVVLIQHDLTPSFELSMRSTSCYFPPRIRAKSSRKFQQNIVMAEPRNEERKAERYREYNRQAQRAFRQRRKVHLSMLEQAQKEATTLLDQEVERLRQENQALLQENRRIKVAIGFRETCHDHPPVHSGEVRSSRSIEMHHSRPSADLEPARAANVPVTSCTVTTVWPQIQDPGNLVAITPTDVCAVRRSLHQLFAPLLRNPRTSDPRSHFATLHSLEPVLPSALKPSLLQLSIPHSVYIDIIPSVTLRDRLIVAGPGNAHYFLANCCTVACEIEDAGQMTIWGGGWLDEDSWEFSASALERWHGWLLTPEWVRRANFWRRQRVAPNLPGYNGIRKATVLQGILPSTTARTAERYCDEMS